MGFIGAGTRGPQVLCLEWGFGDSYIAFGGRMWGPLPVLGDRLLGHLDGGGDPCVALGDTGVPSAGVGMWGHSCQGVGHGDPSVMLGVGTLRLRPALGDHFIWVSIEGLPALGWHLGTPALQSGIGEHCMVTAASPQGSVGWKRGTVGTVCVCPLLSHRAPAQGPDLHSPPPWVAPDNSDAVPEPLNPVLL